jgi:hypothetical protein
MTWKAFRHEGKTYSLQHLDRFVLPIQGQTDTFYVSVTFSHHCFTVKEVENSGLKYPFSPNRDPRDFCFTRYELSKGLRQILENTENRKVFFTEDKLVYVTYRNNEDSPYCIYFDVKKSHRQKKHIDLHVRSAYPRTQEEVRTKMKYKIAFKTLLDKIERGDRIKPAPPRR